MAEEMCGCGWVCGCGCVGVGGWVGVRVHVCGCVGPAVRSPPEALKSLGEHRLLTSGEDHLIGMLPPDDT